MVPPQPKRLVRIIARLNVGGPARHVILLNERFRELGWDPLLVYGRTSDDEGSMEALAETAGLRRIWLPHLKRRISPLSDLIAGWKIYRILRRERPEIVHTHTAKAGALGRLAAWLARVPIRLHTHHGHLLHGYFSPRATRLVVALERWLGRISDRIITVTDLVRNDLIAAGIAAPEQILTVPLGLDLGPLLRVEARRGQWRRELGYDDEHLIGIVARLVPIKDHDNFLRAVKELLSRRSPAGLRFLIIGDGELREELETLTQSLGVEPSVRFCGFQNDIVKVLADLDLMVLSSLNEGSPVAAIEAMTAGVPIVATEVGGVPDVLRGVDSAMMVPASDPAALAEAMARFIDDIEEYHQKAQAFRRQAHDRFSIDRLVLDLQTVYQEIRRQKLGRV